VLCREGDAAAHVIVIRSGWAKVEIQVAGRTRIVTVRGSGDVVGERAALTMRARSATVTALGDLHGTLVPAGEFRALVDRLPRVLQVLERQEHERLAEDDEHLCRRDPASVEHRMAFLLRELAFRRGELTADGTRRLTLPMSRREVADWVDGDADTIGRTLNGWKRRGIVHTARRSLTVLNAGGLDEMCRHRSAATAWSELNCSIFYTDVAGFSGTHRDGQDRQKIRDELYRMLRECFEESGVSWAACYHEDRGDGVLVIVPPALPTRVLTDPLLALLTAKLRRHNHQASEATRIQLRAALHVGPVAKDAEGLSGDAVIHTARLLDAPVLKEALLSSGADLAFMASAYVFDHVIWHGPGLVDPATFERVDYRLKESQITAWMHVAVASRPPPPPVAAPVAAPRPSGGTVFQDSVRVDGDLILGNKIINNG